MDDAARKRQSPADGDSERQDPAKRPRTDDQKPASKSGPNSDAQLVSASNTETSLYELVNQTTAHDVGRDGLRRSIALALQHVGFEGASVEALESFTEATETYINRFVGKLKREAVANRREDPTADQYEDVLTSFNIPISSLKPHLRNPLPKKKRALVTPQYYDPIVEDIYKEFGLLNMSPLFVGHELDGNKEKEEKEWIPKSFPGFPALHSYKYTPVEVTQQEPQKKRAEAAADARNGEKALRRIDRAAKISHQKELRELAARNPLSKQRSDAWEDLMKDLLPRKGATIGPFDIADNSTIVNSGAKYLRKEVPRTGRRGHVEASG